MRAWTTKWVWSPLMYGMADRSMCGYLECGFGCITAGWLYVDNLHVKKGVVICHIHQDNNIIGKLLITIA